LGIADDVMCSVVVGVIFVGVIVADDFGAGRDQMLSVRGIEAVD
jgi:hypothetical protein